MLWEELHKADSFNIHTVIHLAGLAHDTKNTKVEDDYYRVNYEMTRHLYEWYLKSSADKFVFVSSVKAAPDNVDDILTEDITPMPQTPYGKSKLKAEQFIQEVSLGRNDKAYYILRPCMVHGPGNKGNLNLFYKFITKGLPYPLAAFDNKRSFLSIENFSFIVKSLLSNKVESGVYNMADDEPMSTLQLFSTIAAASGRKEKVWRIPAKLVSWVARLGDTFKLPLNTERLNKLTENYVVSNKKIKSALGISSLPVQVEEGITKTISSFSQSE